VFPFLWRHCSDAEADAMGSGIAERRELISILSSEVMEREFSQEVEAADN
jgi:hypothetical protein